MKAFGFGFKGLGFRGYDQRVQVLGSWSRIEGLGS
jgi:hypothetical protein